MRRRPFFKSANQVGFDRAFAGSSARQTIYDNMMFGWRLEEASGPRFDSGPNGFTLTDNNTVTQATGVVGNCAHFTRANAEYLSVASAAQLQVGALDFSLCGWVRFTTLTEAWFIVKRNYGVAAEYALFTTGTNVFWRVFSAGGEGAYDTVQHPAGLSLATWLHIYVQKVGSTLGISFNNGALTTFGGSMTAANTSSPVQLGGIAGYATGYLDGDMDSWYGWRRILTANERSYMYNIGVGREP